MTVIEEHRARVGGYETCYLAAGSGQPLLLVHGIGGSSLMFRANITELASHYRVYALDLPGHGRSEKPDVAYAAEDAVPYLIAFISEICGGPTALIGASAGGLMCALTAAAHPELVTHLVMVSSAGLGRDLNWGLRLLSLPVVRPWLENVRHDPAAVRYSLRQSIYDPDKITDELVSAVCEERALPGHSRALCQALRHNITLFGLRRWRRRSRIVRGVTAPVMVIWGRQDRFIPVRHAYRAMKWFAGAPVHIFDRCGHWPPFEHPTEFNRLVTEFVGRA